MTWFILAFWLSVCFAAFRNHRVRNQSASRTSRGKLLLPTKSVKG